MTRNIALLAVVLCLSVPSHSLGASVPYVSGRIGYTLPQDESIGPLGDVENERSLSLTAAHGHELDRGYGRFRLEAELSYRQNELDRIAGGNARGHARVAAAMVNAVGAVSTGTLASPYLLAGAGGAWTMLDDAKVGGVKVSDDARLQGAYQLGAGVEFALTRSVALDLGYRYFSTSRDPFDAKGGGRFLYRYRAHDVGLALLFRF